MTTLISRPIFGLGSRTLSTASVFRRSRVLYDYALGEIGLLAANSKDYPYQRATAPFKKDQFDNSGNPGEQTLTNWWLRSQASFHYGSGVKFMEPSVTAYVPRSQDESMNGFRKSAGVNPWTPG